MSKHVLIVAYHFPPQAASSGIQRTLSFSKHLGSDGWNPIVLSANPLAYEHKNSSQLASLPADLIIRRTFAFDSKRHLGILGRYPEIIALPDRWISWCFSAIPVGLSLIRKYKPSVIWSTFPIATSHLIALSLKRLTGLPWVADFRDPMLQSNFPTSKLQRKVYQWIEHHTITQCDQVVFTTYSALESYKQRFPASLHYKFTVIENGFDEDSFLPGLNCGQSNYVKTPHRITLLHSGVLYSHGRDPSAFFQAISSLKEKQVVNSNIFRVVLRAPGDIQYFRTLIQKYEVEDVVQVEPPVSYQEALNEMLSADGLLVFQGTPFNTQIPAKIYEYFWAKKPIFGLIDPIGETAKVLRAAGFSDLASIQSADLIAASLEGFISNIRRGIAYVASDELIAASSRKNRSRQLAQIFNHVSG